MSASRQQDTPTADERPSKKTGLLTIIVHHSITVLILVLFLALGVWSYLNLQATEFFTTVDHDELEAELYPPLEHAQKQRLQTAIETYSLRHDRYPRRLSDLTDEAGLLHSSDLYYPRDVEYWAYQAGGEGYSLEMDVPTADE